MHDDYRNVVEEGEKLYTGFTNISKQYGTNVMAALKGDMSQRPVFSLCPLEPWARRRGGNWCVQVDYDYPMSAIVALAVSAIVSARW